MGIRNNHFKNWSLSKINSKIVHVEFTNTCKQDEALLQKRDIFQWRIFKCIFCYERNRMINCQIYRNNFLIQLVRTQKLQRSSLKFANFHECAETLVKSAQEINKAVVLRDGLKLKNITNIKIKILSNFQIFSFCVFRTSQIYI